MKAHATAIWLAGPRALCKPTRRRDEWLDCKCGTGKDQKGRRGEKEAGLAGWLVFGVGNIRNRFLQPYSCPGFADEQFQSLLYIMPNALMIFPGILDLLVVNGRRRPGPALPLNLSIRRPDFAQHPKTTLHYDSIVSLWDLSF
jgi:hypothetical protein